MSLTKEDIDLWEKEARMEVDVYSWNAQGGAPYPIHAQRILRLIPFLRAFEDFYASI